jgi:hypothetical protein
MGEIIRIGIGQTAAGMGFYINYDEPLRVVGYVASVCF